MLKQEQKLWSFVAKHAMLFLCIGAAVVSVLLRASMWDVVSLDMQDFLIDWVAQLRNEGLAQSLREPASDYNAVYIVLLWIFSHFFESALTVVKSLSTMFDAVNAVLLGALAWRLCPQERKKSSAALAFSLGCLLPIPLLNSAQWGQCDAIHTCFLLASLLCLVREKYPAAVLWFSLALCMKLQALFFFPVLVLAYLANKRFSALWFLCVPGALLGLGAACIPAGCDIWMSFRVYANQMSLYPRLTANYPNWYAFVEQGDYGVWSKTGILLALTVFAVAALWTLHRRIRFVSADYILLAVWSVFACTLCLPAMHERYAFFAELAIWVYIIITRERAVLAAALLSNGVTFCAYIYYFYFPTPMVFPLPMLALANYAAFALITACLVRRVTRTSQKEEKAYGA